MDKMIVVGNDIFDEFIRDDGYYVDKMSQGDRFLDSHLV